MELLIEFSELNNITKTSSSVTGTTTLRRAIARCWHRRSGRLTGRRPCALHERSDYRADFDGISFVDRDAGERARRRRRNLDRHLVRFQFAKRLIDRYRVTRLLEPLPDRRLRNALAQRRHSDFYCHFCGVLGLPAQKFGGPVAHLSSHNRFPTPCVSATDRCVSLSVLLQPAPSALRDGAREGPSRSKPPPTGPHSAPACTSHRYDRAPTPGSAR